MPSDAFKLTEETKEYLDSNHMLQRQQTTKVVKITNSELKFQLKSQPSPTSHVTLNKLLNLSILQFLTCKTGENNGT